MNTETVLELSFTKDDSGGSGSLASEIARRIRRSVAYMAEHLDEPLQVSALAAHANVSPSHYFALFKQQIGRPPIDFFIRLRMNHARQLLDSTSCSVKEIAASLGYHDQFYFSRVFKSVHQVAPTEYRRRNGKPRAAEPASGRSIKPLSVFDTRTTFAETRAVAPAQLNQNRAC